MRLPSGANKAQQVSKPGAGSGNEFEAVDGDLGAPATAGGVEAEPDEDFVEGIERSGCWDAK